jgi:hypothetical protein
MVSDYQSWEKVLENRREGTWGASAEISITRASQQGPLTLARRRTERSGPPIQHEG